MSRKQRILATDDLWMIEFFSLYPAQHDHRLGQSKNRVGRVANASGWQCLKTTRNPALFDGKNQEIFSRNFVQVRISTLRKKF
jgi:hypothetical protein